MSNKPITPDVLSELRVLDRAQENLRREYGISKVGECVWGHTTDSDRRLEVIADGYGGAVLQWINPLGSDDHLILETRKFSTESAACQVAERFKDFDPHDGDLEIEDMFDKEKVPDE